LPGVSLLRPGGCVLRGRCRHFPKIPVPPLFDCFDLAPANPGSLATTIRSVKKLADRSDERKGVTPRAPQPSPRPNLDHATPNAPAFDIADNVEFYQKYIQLFRNGVFRCARAEEGDHPGEIINRLYFSGAIRFDALPLRATTEFQRLRDSIPAE